MDDVNYSQHHQVEWPTFQSSEFRIPGNSDILPWKINKEGKVAFVLKTSKMSGKMLSSEKNRSTDTINQMDAISPKDYIDARQNAYEKSVDNRLDRFEKKIDEYRKETKEEMKAFINEMKADNKSTRTTTIVTAITTVISIVGGIAAFNSSLISNMQQSYGMGKEGAVIQQKVVALEHRMDGLEQRMDGLEQRMNSVESKLDKIIEQTAK